MGLEHKDEVLSLFEDVVVSIPHGGLGTLTKVFIQRNGKWILLTLSPSHPVGLEHSGDELLDIVVFVSPSHAVGLEQVVEMGAGC